MAATRLPRLARTARERAGRPLDARAEALLRAVSATLLLLIGGMIVFVFVKAWPSFAANGLSWFAAGGDVEFQLQDIFNSPADPNEYVYELRAFPLLYGTFLTTAIAVGLGLTLALLTAIFVVEFAPPAIAKVLVPVLRLLAAVPSVVYGLIGILVLAPFVGNELISQERKDSVIFVVSLTGQNLLTASLVLTVMITPIMCAICTDALRAVPRPWIEGSAALGVNRWRTVWRISVRTARPAIVAAAVLATARALGEAIMLSMVGGSVPFSPNPIDGLTFFFEPVRPLAATIVDSAEGLGVPPFGQTVYAFAAVLLVSSAFLSLGGWYAKQPMRKYGLN